VVVCLFSGVRSGKRQCRVYWLCVRLARTLCSNQNSWQTAATAQFELHASNHLCASPGVYVWSSRTCMLHLTVLTCCTNLYMQQVHFICMKGVTQEQCAGMMRHPLLLSWRHRLQPCACSNVKMALKQTLVSAAEQTNKLKVMPGLHKSPCTSCHTQTC
jgi:hypothetical protein